MGKIFKSLLLSGLFLLVVNISNASAATFTVNSTLDTSDASAGDGICADALAVCTLRAALEESNALAGTDTVNFNIGAGQQVITPASAYPQITDTILLSAASVWDTANSRPGILIEGSAVSVIFDFATGSAGSMVAGLETNSPLTYHYHLNTGSGTTAIGTNCDGLLDTEERNVMRGGTVGVRILTAANEVRGNYIGIQNDGLTVDGFTGYGIQMYGPTADDNIIGFKEGSLANCTAAQQRNTIGSASSTALVYLSSASTNSNGDATLAPNNNRISGNYIGIGSDGSTDITSGDYGIYLRDASTLNFIGTDGDGVDDASEGNIIAGLVKDGVKIYSTGNNRISGNLIGFTADGLSNRGVTAKGMTILGLLNIVGWCDTTKNATICSDAGSQATQANIIGFSGADGIRIGSSCDGCMVYGNYIGTDATGIPDYGNGDAGIQIARSADSGKYGGASANERNVIKYNTTGGIYINGMTHGGVSATPVTDPTESWVIQNNIISSNDDYGIRVFGTESNNTVDPDGAITGNTIADNIGRGLIIEGSSPSVTSNTITGNGSYGIEVISTYLYDEPYPSAAAYNNPYDTLSPNNAAADTVSEPAITLNTINTNSNYGVFILDSEPTNMDTLNADNTIGTNTNGKIRQDWYAGVEPVFNGSPLASGDLVVTLVPSNSEACPSLNCSGNTFLDAGSGNVMLSGSSGVYNNATTWFQPTEVVVDNSDVVTTYNPYSILFQGRYSSDSNATYTFDGVDTGEVNAVGLPAGITTGGIDRYQIAEVSLKEVSTGANVIAPIEGVDIDVQKYVDFADELTPVTDPNLFVNQKLFIKPRDILGQKKSNTFVPLAALGMLILVGHIKAVDNRKERKYAKIIRKRKIHLAIGASIITIIVLVIHVTEYKVFPVDAYSQVDNDVVILEGSEVRFDFEITNNGTERIPNIVFKNVIPKNISTSIDFVTVPDSEGLEYSDNLVTYKKDFLDGSETIKISIKGVITASGVDITNHATVTGSNISDSLSNEVKLTVASEADKKSYDALNTKFQLVSGEDSTLVFMVDVDGKLRPFYNSNSFYSWRTDFSEVVEMPSNLIDSQEMGDFMFVRTGTSLVKIPSEPFVYAIEPKNTLRWIPSEDEAERIYGEGWNNRVADIDRSTLSRYTLSNQLSEGEWPSGLIVSDGQRMCYVFVGTCRPITKEGMDANSFNYRFVVSVDSSVIDSLPKNTPITELEEPLMTDWLN